MAHFLSSQDQTFKRDLNNKKTIANSAMFIYAFHKFCLWFFLNFKCIFVAIVMYTLLLNSTLFILLQNNR